MNVTAESRVPATADAAAAGDARVALGRHRALRGANAYFERTVIRQRIYLGPLAGLSSRDAGAGFAFRFARRFARPPVARERNGTGEFLRRLHGRDGVPMEEALLAAILACDRTVAELMRRGGDIRHARVFRRADGASVDCVWETRSPGLSRRAAETALAGFVELLPTSLAADAQVDLPSFVDARAELVKRARRRRWSAAMAVIDGAARQLGIPCSPLGQAYLRLGQGVAQQVVCAATPVGQAGLVTQSLRHDRDLQRRLRSAGVPVPLRLNAANLDEARSAAESLGFPVRVKPVQASSLPAVGIPARDDAELERTVRAVLPFGQPLILEPWLRGARYRLLVVAQEVVAAARLRPPVVEGDGRRNVLQLVDELNRDSWRDGATLHRVKLDADAKTALALAGCAPADVLPLGRRLTLAHAATVARGAESADVTDELHPELERLAVRAAQAAGLEVAGVDVVTTDIAKSADDADTAVTDVSAVPDLWLHERPRWGRGRRVGIAILRRLYPDPGQARLPTALVVGDRRTTRVARACDAVLRAAGLRVGLAGLRGSTVDGRAVHEGTVTSREPLRFLESDGRVEALVSATTLRRAARRGLAVERPTVTAIAHVDASRTGRRPVLAAAIRATNGTVVATGASVARCGELAGLSPDRLMLVALRPTRRVREHVAAGGRAVVAATRDGLPRIQVYDSGECVRSLEQSSSDRRGLRSELFAIGVAIGLGIGADEIARRAGRMRVRRAL